MTTKRELISCSNCKGKGVLHRSELTCYHKGEYDEWYEDCSDCGGSGHVWEITEIKYKPYVKPKTGR